jgi:hypothetical protein
MATIINEGTLSTGTVATALGLAGLSGAFLNFLKDTFSMRRTPMMIQVFREMQNAENY